MLAGRLVHIAKDILTEYSAFKIPERLSDAQRASTQRASAQDQYIQQARALRAWAQTVLTKSLFNNYPEDFRQLLSAGNYATALPSNIARIILTGFPDDPHLAISSSEVGLYLNLVNSTASELSAFLAASAKFNVEQIIVLPDEISLDVLIPRRAFENQATVYIDVLLRFARLMSYLIELTTGTARSPTLEYTSTSDPVTGFAMLCGSAWAVLNVYKLLLETAEKQLGLLKTLRDFRASGLVAVPDLDEKIKSSIDESLQTALDKTIAQLQPKVPEDRVNEIKIGIMKDARIAVRAIENGARISVTIESLEALPQIVAAVPGLTAEKLAEELAAQRALESRVQQSVNLLGEPPALLPSADVAEPPAR